MSKLSDADCIARKLYENSPSRLRAKNFIQVRRLINRILFLERELMLSKKREKQSEKINDMQRYVLNYIRKNLPENVINPIVQKGYSSYMSTLERQVEYYDVQRTNRKIDRV